MPIFKCPENYAEVDFVNNQTRIKQLSGVIKSTRKKTVKNTKIYTYLKKIRDSIRDFFRNFSKIVKIIFINKEEDVIYMAVVCYGGLGDITRYKAVLLEIIKMCPNIVIDVYNKTARCLFKDIENIRFYLNIDAVNAVKKRYDVVFEFNYFTVNPLLINKKKQFVNKLSDNLAQYKNDYSFCFKFPIYEKDDFVINNINIINLLKITSGVNNIKDISFTIKAEKLLLTKFGIDDNSRFLTFQCGVGSSGVLDDTRCWSIENWENLLTILRIKLTNIKFIQVGTSKHSVPGADINLSGKTSLSELFCVLNKSLFHIDIDGACSHFARAVGTKSLVMFGPTDGKFIGYPDNINVISSLCRNCWSAKCPLGHARPICMESIYPEFVAEKVIGYLKNYEKN